jgi:hypothetical protein
MVLGGLRLLLRPDTVLRRHRDLASAGVGRVGSEAAGYHGAEEFVPASAAGPKRASSSGWK